MRGGKKFVRAPTMINISLAIGVRVMGILLSNMCQFFIVHTSLHMYSRLAILLLCSISSLLNCVFPLRNEGMFTVTPFAAKSS